MLRCVGVQDETRLIRDLGLSFVHSVIPDHCCEHIFADLQLGRDVHGFISPMRQVATRRTPRHALAVYEKLVSIVARDVDHKAVCLCRQIKGAPEMIDAEVLL
jgi:hypothetical protein